MKVFKEGVVPVKLWGDMFEAECISQITNVSKLPFAFHHVALMPDGHSGYGMPIGGVFASKNYVVPNMVGVDIGCGMHYVKTNVDASQCTEEILKHLIGSLREKIPVGQKVRGTVLVDNRIKELNCNIFADRDYASLGTLGGGNHFLQLSQDSDGKLSILIHTGSRNFGKKVCDYWNGIAKLKMEEYFSSIPSNWDLAFLNVSSDAAFGYVYNMNCAVQFAKYNREAIADIAVAQIKEVFPYCSELSIIDCKHNYAELENHFGKNVWIHRKGAIRARENDVGIIPGSMGTPSYIVKGLGNKESFCSASHGAGRTMSRTEANKTISVEDANKSIEGVVYGRWGNDRKGNVDVSESPLAYKDINTVMEAQRDLVEVTETLLPIAVLKE